MQAARAWRFQVANQLDALVEQPRVFFYPPRQGHLAE